MAKLLLQLVLGVRTMPVGSFPGSLDSSVAHVQQQSERLRWIASDCQLARRNAAPHRQAASKKRLRAELAKRYCVSQRNT